MCCKLCEECDDASQCVPAGPGAVPTASDMMDLQFLSTMPNFRPSSGICAQMSGEEKMGSRYIQVD